VGLIVLFGLMGAATGYRHFSAGADYGRAVAGGEAGDEERLS
jgi:hypothetical protein